MLIIFAVLIISEKSHAQKSPIGEALSECYLRYAVQRNNEGDGPTYLKFYKRSKKAKDGKLLPYDPIELGIDVTNNLEVMLTAYNRLMRFRIDDNILTENYNMVAHLQCLFDCWIAEDMRTEKGPIHSRECEILFFHNLNSLENRFLGAKNNDEKPTLEAQDDVINYKYKSSKLCDSVYFEKDKYVPNIRVMEILANVIRNTDSFNKYHILITGYIDWDSEAHYARVLAKKRMVFLRDLLVQHGIPNNNISGDIKEQKATTEAKIRRRVKICVTDALLGGRPGKRFVETFDYNQSGEMFKKDLEMLAKRKK